MRRLLTLLLIAAPAAHAQFGPRDDILFLYNSNLTTPDDFPAVIDGLKRTGIDKVLLISPLVQDRRWEPLVGQIRQVTWGQVGTHFYPYAEPGQRGDYPDQIVRAVKLKTMWFGYCDGCDHIFIRHPERSYEENRAAVDDYLRAVKAAIVRQPGLLMASGYRQDLTTGYGSADQHEDLVPYIRGRIEVLDAFRRSMGTALTVRLDLGWVGPPMPGPNGPQTDWPLERWGWLLTEAERAGYPLTLCLSTEYLQRRPPALDLIGAWKRRTQK